MMGGFVRRIGEDAGATRALARGLGWFSIGIGLAECLAPGAVARTVGLSGKDRLVQAFGLREIATGVGTLMAQDPTPWIWGRVGGDLLDLGVLASALRDDNPHRGRAAVAMLAIAQVTAVDAYCANGLTSSSQPAVSSSRLRRIDYGYGARSGFREAASAMRGAALKDFVPPEDMRTPQALRPRAYPSVVR